MEDARLISIHLGKIAPLGPESVPSGFAKLPVMGPVRVLPLGLEGDEQADLSVHGGPEKAVYAYPFAHYADWKADYPRHGANLVPGGFGENFCVDGLREADLCVGDIHRIGTSLLQVCQPRQPCFKLALRFDDKMLPKAMVRTGRAGWYYRVLETGEVRVGDGVQLAHRPNPDFSFARLVELVSMGKATPSELELLQNMVGLSRNWQERARAALTGDQPDRG